MERPYLLTYRQESEQTRTYDWFYSEEDLKDFIKKEKPYQVFDILKITNVKIITVESDE